MKKNTDKLSELEYRYPTLFFYDMLSYFIRYYVVEQDDVVRFDELCSVLGCLYPFGEYLVDDIQLRQCLQYLTESYAEYRERYVIGGIPDTVELLLEIVGSDLGFVFKEDKKMPDLLLNSIKINYYLDRSDALDGVVDMDDGKWALAWMDNLVRFDSFKFI